ncbi:MAG: hypothetical protein ABFC67_04905 [Mizugakiibacter sp.]|uniref:phage major capsid protein n=1 Tax=Mizugakiibacter sp. TaxID=1972610 RepID=UPI00320C8643
MRISNFAQLAQLKGDDRARLKALHQAISLEFSAPALCEELLGESQAGLIGKGITLLEGTRAPKLPDAQRIKSFLARKWATPDDNPILSDVAMRIESFFHSNMPEIDLGYQNLFQLVDLRQSSQDSFDIIDTNGGITWEQRAPGAAVKPRREISESSTAVKYVTWASGIGLLDDWLRFNKFWNVQQVVDEFRATAFDKKAEMHYGLLTALGAGVETAFDTDDTKTFNNAAATILRNARAKGYAVGQNAGFWIVCAPEKLGRTMQMLEATQGSAMVAFQASRQPLAYRVAGVIATTFVGAADTGYYLVLPGRKLQRGEWQDLAVESQRDIYASATDWVGTQKFNAAIGDQTQVRRVKYA